FSRISDRRASCVFQAKSEAMTAPAAEALAGCRGADCKQQRPVYARNGGVNRLKSWDAETQTYLCRQCFGKRPGRRKDGEWRACACGERCWVWQSGISEWRTCGKSYCRYGKLRQNPAWNALQVRSLERFETIA